MKRKSLALLSFALTASTALAQTNGGTGTGLDHLDEQTVMAQLANNNLTTLMQRDFVNFKIPETEQAQVMTLILLKQLTNPIGLNVALRRALAGTVAKGLDQLSIKQTDPSVLYEQANELFLYGIVPTVTALEYFGENPAAQTQLKPVAQIAKKLYTRVADLADAKVDAMASKINQANINDILPKLQKIRETKVYGIYSDNMATYALCITLPKTDPQRKKLADDTIAYLQTLDNPQTGVQPTVRLQIGKLQLVEGNYADSKTTFDTISRLRDITPAPEMYQQNDARYFAIVAEISARKLNDAEGDIPELETWEAQNYLPKLPNPADQASVKAALAMLKFRLYSAQSDLTNDVNVKTQTNNQAIGVLAQLVHDQPALKDLVYDQLIGRIPDQPDLTNLNPLILQALEQQGVDEVLKKTDELTDEKKLTRAIASAKELVTRKGQPGADDAAALRAAYFIAYGYERLHKDKESAAAFMDFAENFQSDTSKCADAMDHASATILKLRNQDRTTGDADPETRKLYDRFLPLAINPPYNRKALAFTYAALLLEEKKYKDSIVFFNQVPPTDTRYPKAQFLEMVALKQLLSDNSLTGDSRKAVVSQVLQLAQAIDKLHASAKNDEDKKTYISWVVSADEIAADLTRRELKDPAQSLKILDGFEDRIAGVPDADKAHVQALHLRIDDYRDMGNIHEATKSLIALMSANQEQGQELMFSVLKTIDSDMDTARASGNTSDLKKLAQDRAKLSGFVVTWAGNSKDPKEQAQLPNYQLYDADSKREAGELIDDPTARKPRLEEAFKEYKDLLQKNPDNLAAQLGLGLSAFSLGRYQEAVDNLAPLMDNSKVLRPTKEIVGPGDVTQVVEDPQFWEANYKRLKSLVELYKNNSTDPSHRKDLSDAHSYLGSLYIINGKKTGGISYHDQFDQLKAEIDGLLASGKK